MILCINPIYYTEDKFYYALRIVTGNQAGAGDSSSIFISLIGDKAKTGKIKVKARTGFPFFTKCYFQRSTYDDLVIESDEDLGDIQVVHAGLHFKKSNYSIFTPDWFIDYFTVANYQKMGATSDFPCYHWIGETVKRVEATSETGIMST